ncbi:MAG TPA: GNAT family N-acetyltransferase [Candidatus Thermoplasmatota archaeon]|nr:GNAT family N-acetyltransferase [Candidatus Thermoplasmatota archaeon]
MSEGQAGEGRRAAGRAALNPVLRPAHAAEVPAVRALLEAAGLPLEGLDKVASLWVATVGGQVAGAVAFERHGNLGLLRSLVVAPQHRGAGLGKRLLVRCVRSMQGAGVTDAYALTTTIAPWLAREGWARRERAGLPRALSASPELQGACPASAEAFHLPLGTGPSPKR